MTLPLTFTLDDATWLASVTRGLGDLNTIIARDEVLVSADGLTYAARRGNWLASPAPEIRVMGVLAPLSTLTLDYPNGTVTFASSQLGQMVVASYTANLWDDAAITTFLEDAFYHVEAQLATSLDDTQVPRDLKPAITLAARVQALDAFLNSNLDGYLWKAGGMTGQEIDRSKIGATITAALSAAQNRLETMLTFLRAQYLAEGKNVVLNLDMDRPPTPWSHFEIIR